LRKNLVVLLCLAILASAACGRKSSSNMVMTLSPASATIKFGSSVNISVSGNPSSTMTWSVSDGRYGTVNSTTIVFVPPTVSGLYSVTVSCGGKTATAKITVAEVFVEISPDRATVGVGEIKQFSATVTNAFKEDVTYTASAGTVTAQGLYTAPMSTGTFSLTAQSVGDPTKKAIALITVKSKITIKGNRYAMIGKTLQFTANVIPTNQSVNWTTTFGSISSSGLFTVPNATGVAGITATLISDSSVSATIMVTVLDQDVFVWFKEYIPSDGGTAEGRSVLSIPNEIVFGIDRTSKGASEPNAVVVLYSKDGNQIKEWANPLPSSISSMTYDSTADRIHVTGVEGSKTDPTKQKALFLTLTTDLSVVTDKSFQVSSMKSEGRDILSFGGNIFLAINSSSEYCWASGQNNYCTNDYIYQMNSSGSTLSWWAASKWSTSGNCRGLINSISHEDVNPTVWISGSVICSGIASDTYMGAAIQDRVGYNLSTAVGGYGQGSYSRLIWDGNGTGSYLPRIILGTNKKTTADKQQMSTGLYLGSDPPQQEWFGSETIFWDGGNPQGFNSLKTMTLVPGGGGVVVGGSLSKVGVVDQTITDGGIALMDMTIGSESVKSAMRLSNLPYGWKVDSVNGIVYDDPSDSENRHIIIAGSSDGKAVIGKTFPDYVK
jgi:hypothetical protein